MKNNLRVLLAKQRKKVIDVYKATGISKTTLTSCIMNVQKILKQKLC